MLLTTFGMTSVAEEDGRGVRRSVDFLAKKFSLATRNNQVKFDPPIQKTVPELQSPKKSIYYFIAGGKTICLAAPNFGK